MSKRFFRKDGSDNDVVKTKWIEMSREEYYHFITLPEGKGRFFIDMGNVVIEASEEEAKLYAAEKNHHDYISKQRKGWLIISLYEAEKEKGFNGEQVLRDSQQLVEDEAIARMEIDAVKKALPQLDENSYSLVYALFLADEPITECDLAKKYGISQAAVYKRKRKILKILENMVIKIQKSQQ